MNQHKNLDHRLFKAFKAAADSNNFTQAAERAAMTQPGISQQISKLEEQLGCALFKRLGKNVKLTDAGVKLVRYINRYFATLESLYEDIHDSHSIIDGQVKYAMPPSCLLSPHFKTLLNNVTKYENLSIQLSLIPNDDVIDLVLNAKVDFGFVTEKYLNSALKYLKFCPEEYILVGAKPTNEQNIISEEELLSNNFIDYPGVKVYCNYWLKHHFPKSTKLDFRSLNYTSSINTIEGAIIMVSSGLGYSLFPRHCISDLLDKKILHEYLPANNDPLLNTIYIVELSDYKQPYRVKKVLEWFMAMVS